MDSMKPLFLAHSSQDKESVRRLAIDLSLRGAHVWFDEWEIKVGESILEKIAAGISSSGWLGLVLSKASAQSEWVKREVNAGLVREIEARSLVVLVLRMDDTEVPLLLREKRYADFRESYDRGLEDLLRAVVPAGASSAFLQTVPELRLHYLPAVAYGRLATPYDLNRVLFAINAAEQKIGLAKSDLSLFTRGQLVRASTINHLLAPIDRLRERCGLKVSWRRHPVKGEEMYTEGHMNELYSSVNEILEAILGGGGDA